MLMCVVFHCPQTLLKDMGSVRHVIYMDKGKRMQTDDFPTNVHIHSMSSVIELGAKPENRKYPGMIIDG